MKKFKRLAALFLALMLLAACSGGGDTTTPPDDVQDPDTQGSQEQDDTQGGEEVTTLKVGLYGDTGGFDPATGTTDTPQQVIKAVYRGLFSIAADGSLQNEICKDYSTSEDGLTITFNLRDDVKWSDGQPVTAADFVYGFKRNLVPELKAAYADLLNAIENFEPCMAGEKPLDEFGVRAVDDTTLEVTLSRPQPYFVQMTTFSPFFPVREDKVPLDSSTWSIEDVQNVVTNGPFKFEQYNPNEMVVLVPNPESYQKDEVSLERIEFYYIPDPQTSVAAFKNGEIDMAYNVPTNINETHDNAGEVVKVRYLVNNILVFSGRSEGFKDVRVREAFNIAIDRQQICDIVGGTAEPLYALIPPGIVNPATGKDFREEGGDLIVEDVERAQQLLAEAGYPGGEGFPEVTYLYNNDNGMHADIAQALQGMIKENLGITITLNGMETQAFNADRRDGKFDIGRFGTSADYADPTTWLNLYMSNTQYISKLTGYETPEFDALMEASELELDPATRFDMLHEAEQIMCDANWWLPILNYDKQILVKEYVKGYYTSTSGDVFIYGAHIEK